MLQLLRSVTARFLNDGEEWSKLPLKESDPAKGQKPNLSGIRFFAIDREKLIKQNGKLSMETLWLCDSVLMCSDGEFVGFWFQKDTPDMAHFFGSEDPWF